MTIEDFFAQATPEEGDRDSRFVQVRAMVEAYLAIYEQSLVHLRVALGHSSDDVVNTPDGIKSFLTGGIGHIITACAHAKVSQRVMASLATVLSGEDTEDYPHLVSKTCDTDEVAAMLRERLIDDALWSGDIAEQEAYRSFIYTLQSH